MAAHWLDKGKLVVALGGDHSSAFGLQSAVAERNEGLGVLQVDAHADLRGGYEGFRWSHASAMRNLLDRCPSVERLVQVGIRDFSDGEMQVIRESGGRIRTFFDADLKQRLDEGEPWAPIARSIVSHLPRRIHVSFDVDGLDPSLCPGTGTPVPGGLSFDQAMGLLRAIVESGRRVEGIDLVEVSIGPEGRDGEWDANVGARLLYKLIGFGLLSRQPRSDG